MPDHLHVIIGGKIEPGDIDNALEYVKAVLLRRENIEITIKLLEARDA